MATQHGELKRLRAPLSAFIVDGFNFRTPSVRHYLLTHAHSDHTCGLSSPFELGVIYCSALTGRFLCARLGKCLSEVMVTIEVGESIHVDGVRITALDAGHCPGSLMFLLEHVASGYRALHTGDCRAAPEIVGGAVAALGACVPTTLRGGGGLDCLYLDTTYASKR